MGVAEQLSVGRKLVAERPGALVVGLVGVLLLVDLVRKLTTGALPSPRFASLLLDGLVIGLAYGLAGIGLSMTYSILNFANFAHGDTVTVGAFAGWSVAYVVGGLGTAGFGSLFLLSANPEISVANAPLVVLVGVVAAGVGTVILSLALDRIVYRPMRDAGGISLLIASIGVALALRYLVAFVYGVGVKGITAASPKLALLSLDGAVGMGVLGPDQRVGELAGPSEVAYYVGLPFANRNVTEVLVGLTFHQITLALAAGGLMLGIHLLLQRTKLGKAMRAMADNKALARVTGIPTERIIRMTWVIGGGLTGVAGFLIVLERGTMSFSFGWILLLFIFAAVILGGIGSVYGAMVGGVVIGVVDSVSIVWLPSSLTTAAAFAILIVVLLLKPDGIFGGVTTA